MQVIATWQGDFASAASLPNLKSKIYMMPTYVGEPPKEQSPQATVSKGHAKDTQCGPTEGTGGWSCALGCACVLQLGPTYILYCTVMEYLKGIVE